MAHRTIPHITPREEQRHSLLVRLAHWLLALSILIMIGSGWRIYNAAPIFPFTFPVAVTLGGDVWQALSGHNDPGVATAIGWHFTAMWGVALAFLVFVANGIVTGHFRRDFLPWRPADFWRDFTAALRFRLGHRLGEYNAVQKAFYWGALFAVLMMLVSGLAIWKPVQLAPLTALLGGFQTARVIHFLFMAALCGFVAVHVALVVLVPKTLVAMVVGRASAPAHGAARGTTLREG
jgi:thiosulfate reductase cytochrome b subunit